MHDPRYPLWPNQKNSRHRYNDWPSLARIGQSSADKTAHHGWHPVSKRERRAIDDIPIGKFMSINNSYWLFGGRKSPTLKIYAHNNPRLPFFRVCNCGFVRKRWPCFTRSHTWNTPGDWFTMSAFGHPLEKKPGVRRSHRGLVSRGLDLWFALPVLQQYVIICNHDILNILGYYTAR